MAKILEEIQTRLAEAQKQLAEATQSLTLAQQKHQAAQHNFNVWNMAFQVEQRDEQLKQAVAIEKQSELPLSGTKPQSVSPLAVIEQHIEQQADNSESPNKTDVVRNLLKQHPSGMSAVDIWKEVGAQFNHRPYLYSVLKRLRDRNEIAKRRNRYCLTVIPKAEEAKEQPIVH
jgi:hypothetical protein